MEMGRRDVNGGSNKQSAGSGFSAKSKKGVLKKLRLADGKLKQEMVMMDYEFSNLENEASKKKSKFPKKNLTYTNGVDHASVPRKLRSAMKKRNLESVTKLSSISKRLNRSKTGNESFKKDLEAKASIVAESMMISKDEKEVAETLYGLAGMFTETGSIFNMTCDEKNETTKVDSIFVVEPDSTKTESLEPKVSVLSSAKSKLTDDNQVSSTGMVDFIGRLKQNSSVNVTDPPARAIETKVVTSDMDYKSNGLVLWPGLSSTVVPKPSSTKLPPWMGQAISTSKTPSILSEQPLRVQLKKLKKCASHIYISRLIKVLQTSKTISTTTLNQNEQRPSQVSETRLPDPVTTTMVSPAKMYQKNPNLLDIHRTYNTKPMQEDMSQLYGPHTSQKQSYDFLTLSSSGAAQSHFTLPNSFPQYHHIPPAYNSHQLSSYLPSRFQTAYNANQQQLQKRLWAAQYRQPTSGNTVILSNQYSKPNLSLNLTSIQQPLHVAQEQHRLMAAAAAMSMSHHHNNNPSRMVMNRQEHHFPLIYEDTRTPLQLLCNEQS